MIQGMLGVFSDLICAANEVPQKMFYNGVGLPNIKHFLVSTNYKLCMAPALPFPAPVLFVVVVI